MNAINAGYTKSFLDAFTSQKIKEREIKAKYGFKENDIVKVYTLAKEHRGKKYGSFSYKPATARAKRLRLNIAQLKAQINKTENAQLPPGEKAAKLHSLRSQVRYLHCSLSTEVHNSPTVAVLVVDPEDE